MTCDHPESDAVPDPAGVVVCRRCSEDVTTPSTVRPEHPRQCWEHPPGVVVTPKAPA